jgi:hypothetical protein
VRKLRIAHLRLLIPFVVIAWRAGLPLGDNSFLWHVRAGTEQLKLGRVLTTDPFSFTALGRPWRTQSWLADLAYGWLERTTGGIEWVLVMKLVLMTLTVAVLGIVVYRVLGGHNGFTLGALLLIVWQAAPFGIARPALVGYLLLALSVAFVFMSKRPLWALPPLFWLWASIHGTFPVGLGLLLLDAIRRRSRRQGIAVAVAGLATAFTAHGVGVWWIVMQFFKSRGALDLISEWQPPDFTNPFLMPLVVVMVGVLFAAVAGRLKTADLWIVVPFMLFGLVAERNVWPAFIVLVPFAVAALPPRARVREGRGESYVINWAIAVVLLAVAVIGVAHPLELREDRFPSTAALAALEPGPLFNGSAVGGYLIYADWPEHFVFIDDRAELYGAEGFQSFQDVKSGLGVVETFEDLDIRQALVNADWPVVEYLELLGWEYRYQDDNFVVMGERS